MPRSPVTTRDTSIRTYRARRDFAATPEPAPREPSAAATAPIFVVQKHDARRLHWDFRLEHGGVLWSWAVPKGPSLDPADKRLAVRTEDHPLDYADFFGTIPEGHYGAGTVETWDRGTWESQGADAVTALDKGELKFVLHGARLAGKFVLVRLKPRPKERAENWLLIKEHDTLEEPGVDAAVLEQRSAPPQAPAKKVAAKPPARDAASGIPDATRGKLPDTLSPQLATTVAEPPQGAAWLSEVKFDGYRLIAIKDEKSARLLTRNGHDWTARLPSIARAVGRLAAPSMVLDGELVALREDGVSSFALLQQALSDGRDDTLFFYAFDLPYLDGWDLRASRLAARKQALSTLSDWRGALRYSDHFIGNVDAMRRQACGMGLEGIICKQADAPYRSGRGRTWLKVKCQGREEFIVLGFTPPAGSRTGLGALHMGYRDPEGALQYVGGVGTGFTVKELTALRRRLDKLVAEPPPGLVYAGEKPESGITWVRPELVAEVQFIGWSGSGRIRHATYLGQREDKSPNEVVRPIADANEKRVPFARPAGATIVSTRPLKSSAKKPPARITAPAARRADDTFDGVRLTHAERELWPGITKRDLAGYWRAVAEHALPEIAGRPLALVRCPAGIDGQRFFQKHGKPGFPSEIRADAVAGAPYLAIDDLAGLIACAQVAAIELHAWGSRESDGERPDRLVFDLDPADDVPFAETVRAAHEVRERLRAAGLDSFCRTTGGKGLHIVAPLRPAAAWDTARPWCRGFAEAMAADSPDRFVSRLAKQERGGKILVDWLRNGLGSTAVASFSPRARPGATVATRLAWHEVVASLDPATFTIASVPPRLRRQRADPWAELDKLDQTLPEPEARGRTKRRR